MKETLILRIALGVPIKRLFDYLPPQAIDPIRLVPGIRVSVPFQSKTLVGILIELVKESNVPYEKLKRAHALLDEAPLLPRDLYELCHFAADYYHYALGEVLMSAMPSLLRKGRSTTIKQKQEEKRIDEENQPILNVAQQQAIQTICAAKNSFQVFLLDGVTGSGKTEVYLRVIAEILNDHRQILVLVPEISLTPQTIERFHARFHHAIAMIHSSLSEPERLRVWLSARANEIKIVIGTRSAIFTPFANLGLIIIDEEHDTSFKQQERFRYHARDLAIMRASMNTIPIVLGSATPSLESLLNVKRNRYEYLSLPMRAGNAQLPQYQLIDLRQQSADQGLSNVLLNMIREHLNQDNQVMLFLNRRGFAPVLFCKQCGWIAKCHRCDARMVYHSSPPRLHCHHCDSRHVIPTRCIQCQEAALQALGIGTQKLEQALEHYFPGIPIIRVDRDNTRRKGAMQNLLEQIQSQKKAILLGTQMLAKGHHFPLVTLVGIVDADGGLLSADFRATEQMGQLLLQVSGRAGRAEKAGTVVIQTYQPEHPLLQMLTQKGYQPFAETLLAEREQALLPPFSYFAIFRAEAYVEKNASDFLITIKALCATFPKTITLLGPVPAAMAKRKGLYCHHLLLKSNQRHSLQKFLKQLLQQIEKIAAAHSVKWMLDVDPIEVI